MKTELHVIEDGWVVGWEHIKSYTDQSTNVLRNLAKNYGFPLRHTPGGRPAIIISEVNMWLRAFSEASSPFRLRNVVKATHLAFCRKAAKVNLGPGKGKYVVVGQEDSNGGRQAGTH